MHIHPFIKQCPCLHMAAPSRFYPDFINSNHYLFLLGSPIAELFGPGWERSALAVDPCAEAAARKGLLTLRPYFSMVCFMFTMAYFCSPLFVLIISANINIEPYWFACVFDIDRINYFSCRFSIIFWLLLCSVH